VPRSLVQQPPAYDIARNRIADIKAIITTKLPNNRVSEWARSVCVQPLGTFVSKWGKESRDPESRLSKHANKRGIIRKEKKKENRQTWNQPSTHHRLLYNPIPENPNAANPLHAHPIEGTLASPRIRILGYL
jgi:hypothetical protein